MTKEQLFNRRNALEKELEQTKLELGYKLEVGDKVSYMHTTSGLRTFLVYGEITDIILKKDGTVRYYEITSSSAMNVKARKQPESVRLESIKD